MNTARHSDHEQMNGSKFVVEHRFECPICLTCLKDPLLTSCGHRFCQECIHEWLKQKDGLCPIDSQALSITKDLFPDNFTRREIAHQTRNCPVEGCSQLLPLLEIEKHISSVHKECSQQEETVMCTFHNIGCNFQMQSMQQLNTHLDSHLHQHLALLASSLSSAQRRQSDFKAQESQLWEAPSKNGNENQEESWKDLLKSLYERIILLEQSNREQEIQITSLRAQVNRLVEENENLKYNIPLQFCNGVCVWTIDKFQEKYLSMTQDNNRCFYSPAFTTSYVGYKFCARLKLSIEDPNYLSLLIHLKQGEFDRVLEWPFSGRISFSLIHPTNPDLTIKETMMSRPELEAFKQPSRDISPRGFGYSEFVLVSDVMTKGFLDKDSLIIKVQIQTV